MTSLKSIDSHPYTPGHSATAHVVDQLQVYGYHPGSDEPDPRPLPEASSLEGSVIALFDILAETLADTRLEPDLQDLLWHLANLFHNKADRVQRQLDDNETAQRDSQDQQDGSEIRSVELERLICQGLTMLERRNTFEALRDTAAETYQAHTGSAWRPRAGSLANRKTMTAAIVDSRDFLKAKTYAETKTLLPPGPCVIFSGGVEYNDHTKIWATLDAAHARHPDMNLVHGGTNRGAEKIAACWADNRKVPQIVYKPDFVNEGRAAPFKRNDRMLAETQPLGVIVFPGSGITDNLADKAKKARVMIKDCRKDGA